MICVPWSFFFFLVSVDIWLSLISLSTSELLFRAKINQDFLYLWGQSHIFGMAYRGVIVYEGPLLIQFKYQSALMKKRSCKRPLGVWNNRHSGLEPHLPHSCVMWCKILEIKCSFFLMLSLHMVFQAQDLPPNLSFAKWVLLQTPLELSVTRNLFFSGRFFRRQPRNPLVICSSGVRGLQKSPLGERGTLNKSRDYFWRVLAWKGQVVWKGGRCTAAQKA